MKHNQWDILLKEFSQIAKNLEHAGAEALIICTNTIHKIAEDLQKMISIPIIHIVDVIGKAALALNIKTIGILGTRTTMEEPFYSQRLQEKFQIQCLIPSAEDRQTLDDIIFKELARGEIKPRSKDLCLRLIKEFEEKGAQGVVSGCTEIPLVITQKDVRILLIDSLELHIQAVFEFLCH